MNNIDNNLVVLYAEDDYDDFTILADAFKSFDESIELVRAENGVKVIDYLNEAETDLKFPDLIVLDLNMPVMDGKETLIRLKSSERYSHIPVVIFTTSSDARDKRILDQYNVPFFTKPISYQDLTPIVKKFVDHSGSNPA